MTGPIRRRSSSRMGNPCSAKNIMRTSGPRSRYAVFFMWALKSRSAQRTRNVRVNGAVGVVMERTLTPAEPQDLRAKQDCSDIPCRTENTQDLEGAGLGPVDDQVRVDLPEAEGLEAEIS